MIRLLVLDVDGTMTDGGVYYDATGNELKKFAIKDGAGLVLARTAGIRVMICTGRECEAVRRRALQSGAVAPAVGLGAKAARRDPRPGEPQRRRERRHRQHELHAAQALRADPSGQIRLEQHRKQPQQQRRSGQQ